MIRVLGSILKKAAETRVQEFKDTATKFFNADDEGKIKMLMESQKNSPYTNKMQLKNVGEMQTEDAGSALAKLQSMTQI
jgi:hypothetical protein